MTKDALCERIRASLATDPEIARFNPTVCLRDGYAGVEVSLRHPTTGEKRTIDVGWFIAIRTDERQQTLNIRRKVLGLIDSLEWWR